MLVTQDLRSFNIYGFSLGDYTSATWTGERYVAVGGSGRIIISDDGSQLISPSSPTSEDLLDVVANTTGLVAIGRNGTLLYSTDGVSWENHSLNDGTTFTRVETIGDDFYAVGTEGIYHSEDGRVWQQIEIVPDAESQPEINDIAYDGTTFVATTGNRYGQLYTSTDGVNWIRRDPRADDGYYYLSVEYTGHEFIALHDGITRGAWIDASADGIAWTRVYTFPSELSVNDMAWTGNGFVLAARYDTSVIIGTVQR